MPVSLPDPVKQRTQTSRDSNVSNYMRDPVRREQERSDQITYMLHLIDKGRDGIRLRVGTWRVIMEDGVILAVLEIGARGSVYD